MQNLKEHETRCVGHITLVHKYPNYTSLQMPYIQQLTIILHVHIVFPVLASQQK